MNIERTCVNFVSTHQGKATGGGTLRKVLLLAGLAVLGTLLFSSVALAQSASSSASASASPLTDGTGPAGPIDTVPLNPDGTCPEGYVTVNAPFCAQESPNTPGRIFGYGEGDVASVSASATASASASASP